MENGAYHFIFYPLLGHYFPRERLGEDSLVNYQLHTGDHSQIRVHFIPHPFPRIIAHFLLIRLMILAKLQADAY